MTFFVVSSCILLLRLQSNTLFDCTSYSMIDDDLIAFELFLTTRTVASSRKSPSKIGITVAGSKRRPVSGFSL